MKKIFNLTVGKISIYQKQARTMQKLAFKSFIVLQVILLSLFMSSSVFAVAPVSTSAPSYSVSITSSTPSGFDVSLEGTGSADPYAGQLSDHHVQVDWGDGNIDDEVSANFTELGNGTSDKRFSVTWSANHTYTSSGEKTITAKLYHGNLNGHEASEDASDTVDVEIVAPPASTGTLTVTKVVDNTGGGTLEASDFSLFVDGSPVTSGQATTTSSGSHVVSETAVEDYEGVIGGGEGDDCDSEGNVTVPEDGSASCTITNTFTGDNGTSTPDTVTVTIVKYIDGIRATSESADNTVFNMTSTWTAENLNNGTTTSGNFDLDSDGFNGDPTPYQAITSPMTSGADYSVVENNIPASCGENGTYSLDGFHLGNTESGALANATSSTAELTDITSNKFILVMNHDCSVPPQEETGPTLTIIKDARGGDGVGTFNFNITGDTSTSTQITTNSDGNGSVDVDLNEGTSTISELATSGWDFTDANCVYDNESTGVSVVNGETIHVDDDDHVICTFVNTATQTEGLGSITVVKNVVKSNGNAVSDDTDFTVCLTGGQIEGEDCQTVSEDEDAVFSNLTPGTYTVTENEQEDYTLDSYTPDSDSEEGGAQLTVEADANTVITIVNKQKRSSGGHGGGIFDPQNGNSTGGQVLGASIGPDDQPILACVPYLEGYIHYGSANNLVDVVRLQMFLNENYNAGLPITGYYGPLTLAALKKFQVLESAAVLTPWLDAGFDIRASYPTGYVYKTTKWRINSIKCPGTVIPLPVLS